MLTIVVDFFVLKWNRMICCLWNYKIQKPELPFFVYFEACILKPKIWNW